VVRVRDGWSDEGGVEGPQGRQPSVLKFRKHDLQTDLRKIRDLLGLRDGPGEVDFASADREKLSNITEADHIFMSQFEYIATRVAQNEKFPLSVRQKAQNILAEYLEIHGQMLMHDVTIIPKNLSGRESARFRFAVVSFTKAAKAAPWRAPKLMELAQIARERWDEAEKAGK
jgi:hypothetical protein